jgi:hypothetical protein
MSYSVIEEVVKLFLFQRFKRQVPKFPLGGVVDTAMLAQDSAKILPNDGYL